MSDKAGFTPQATPLYAVNDRGRVSLVVGWCRPDLSDREVSWWEPVLIELSELKADAVSDLSISAHSPFPAGEDSDGSMAFVVTPEEAHAIAAQFRAWNEAPASS